MNGFTLLGLLLLIVTYGVWQYRTLLHWKNDLHAWERDLTHREKVWGALKNKVNKDLKWNWKI